MRAVVQVLLDELLQGAAAQTQVLHCVREVAGVGRQRKQLPDDLELLTGVAVEVRHAGLDLADDLAIGAGTQPVFLAVGHGAGTIAAVRVLIFHGYLLRGTGSNIYNASLARALVREGHEVHLLCQERHTEGLDFVDGEHCTVHVPDIGGVLPVYVADTYEGFEAIPFADLTDEQLDTYLKANVAAVKEVVEPQISNVALAKRLVMGPVILARSFPDQ